MWKVMEETAEKMKNKTRQFSETSSNRQKRVNR